VCSSDLVRTAREVTEVLRDQLASLRRLEVAADREHGVVGCVVCAEELLDVLEACRVEVLHRADHRVVIRMIRRIHECLDALVPVAVRLVVDAPAPLVLHDIALVVELLLRHRGKQPAESVALQPETQLEVVRGQRLVVVRAVQPGRAVQRAAGLLDQREVPHLRYVFRALEHHVLEQVGEPRTTLALVPRAHAVPDVQCHDRRGVLAREDDVQAVVETVPLDRNAYHDAVRFESVSVGHGFLTTAPTPSASSGVASAPWSPATTTAACAGSKRRCAASSTSAALTARTRSTYSS